MVLIKRIDASGDWFMIYDSGNKWFRVNRTDVIGTQKLLTFNDDGFTIDSSEYEWSMGNTSGGNYLYMAIA